MLVRTKLQNMGTYMKMATPKTAHVVIMHEGHVRLHDDGTGPILNVCPFDNTAFFFG